MTCLWAHGLGAVIVYYNHQLYCREADFALSHWNVLFYDLQMKAIKQQILMCKRFFFGLNVKLFSLHIYSIKKNEVIAFVVVDMQIIISWWLNVILFFQDMLIFRLIWSGFVRNMSSCCSHIGYCMHDR